MTDPEITALACEYAENLTRRIRKMDGELPNCLLKEALSVAKDDAEDVIRFLLRRFCLVEKRKVKTKHKEALAALESNDNEDLKWGTYRLSLLKSIFPEIAKEVER